MYSIWIIDLIDKALRDLFHTPILGMPGDILIREGILYSIWVRGITVYIANKDIFAACSRTFLLDDGIH